MNIKTFVLTSGIEVIARIEAETETDLTLGKPFAMQLMETNNGVGLALGPFAPVSTDRITSQLKIKKSALMTDLLDPDPNLERRYFEQTSGLMLK